MDITDKELANMRVLCRMLRENEREAIRRQDWNYYYLLHGDRLAIARKYFSHLFFSSRTNS